MIDWKLEDKVPEALKPVEIGTAQKAMTDKADQNIADWISDIKRIDLFKDPIRCPVAFIEELNALVDSGITNSDTERQKRRKLVIAIQGHKKRGLFEDDVKIRIDNITGFSSSIFSNINAVEDWILLGDQFDPDNEWGAIGGDNTDPLGFFLSGDGTEGELSGIVQIDLGSASITPEQIEKITERTKIDLIPAYFIIQLGHIVSGSFIIFPGGVI